MSSIQQFCKGLPQENIWRYFDTKGNGEEWTFAVQDAQEVKYNKLRLLDLVREKLDQGEKVELYSLARKEWGLVVSGSPGNQIALLEFLEVETAKECRIGCLRIKGDYVLLAATDVQGEKEFIASTFIDNDLYTDLEARLVSLGVKELVLTKNTRDVSKLKSLLEKCQIAITFVQDSYFDTKSLKQDLSSIFSQDQLSKTDLNLVDFDAVDSVFPLIGCLVKYLGLMNSKSNFAKYSLGIMEFDSYMKLDGAAVKALNLFPGGQDGALKNRSLFGVLNHCQTAQGCRLLSQWLRQPLLNLIEIEKRQDIVESFVTDNIFRQDVEVFMHIVEVKEHLKKFPDLQRIGQRFEREKANLQDVIRVYQVVLALPEFLETLQGVSGQHQDLIKMTYYDKFKEYTENLSKLKALVETTVDLEAANYHQYMIKAEFHPELQEIREKMESITSDIQKTARYTANDLGLEFEKKLKYEHSPQYGHHLRLSRNDARLIRGKREYIELATQKAGVLFTTSKIRDLCDSYISLQDTYEKLQKDVVKEVLSITASYFPVLEVMNHLISHLDVLVSFATTVSKAPRPYVRPKLVRDGDIILKSSRHPCVELQDNVSFIDNDASFIRGEKMFQIISGPNMGGKSTYIRQVGVNVLMAQIGSFVPCDEAQVSIMTSIQARVGAGDSQLKGISTFMVYTFSNEKAEMLETAAILKSAGPNCLVIIDELGRGTSTSDGFGLAWAISEHLAQNTSCFCYFATHFHELTTLEKQIPTVFNLHVKALAQESDMILLYKVCPGVCDQSFGIHVAELAKFPPSVINLAKQKVVQLETGAVVLDQEAEKARLLKDFSRLESFDMMSDKGAITALEQLVQAQ